MNQVNTRIDWVDTAKGICIVFVVMMNSVLGVESDAGSTGYMHPIVAFAAPFRMPDFFLISGLFLSNVINRDWRLYLDRKVVHFAYFYLLWMTLQVAIKAPSFAQEMGWDGTLKLYAISFVDPFGPLWFIYMLPIFFVVCKVAHDVGIPWQITLGIAAILQMASIHSGILVIDEFASRFVYFFAGFIFAPKIFELAAWARDRLGLSLGILAIWAIVNGSVVYMGWSKLPGVSLALGTVGAGAIILASTLLVETGRLRFLRHFGENSIVIYLAFFFPMAASRVILLKLDVLDVGTVSMIVTTMAIVCPMILFWMIQKTNIGWFLFKRPHWAYLRGTRKRPPGTGEAT